MKDTIGSTYVPYVPYVSFLTLLDHYDFFIHSEDGKNTFSINETSLNDFEFFLKKELKKERCMILNHYAIGILRKIMSHLSSEHESKKEVLISTEILSFNKDDEEMKLAYNQLIEAELISTKNNKILFVPSDLIQKFKYHSILMSFDRTIIYNDE